MADSPSLRARPPPAAARRQRTLHDFLRVAGNGGGGPIGGSNGGSVAVDPGRDTVVSLFDADGSALAPWAARGYRCVQVRRVPTTADWRMLAELQGRVAFACAAPPSRDLSVAGARHWKRKRERDPEFQRRAVGVVRRVHALFEGWDCPYYVANPASSRLRALWREPNHTFQPADYGGYLNPANAHPLYPGVVPPQDAYTQKQGLWTGGGFRMPLPRPVEPTWRYFVSKRGPHAGVRRRMSPVLYSGWRARRARASTPRGFATALCMRLHGEGL